MNLLLMDGECDCFFILEESTPIIILHPNILEVKRKRINPKNIRPPTQNVRLHRVSLYHGQIPYVEFFFEFELQPRFFASRIRTSRVPKEINRYFITPVIVTPLGSLFRYINPQVLNTLNSPVEILVLMFIILKIQPIFHNFTRER